MLPSQIATVLQVKLDRLLLIQPLATSQHRLIIREKLTTEHGI